jgi:hypothetical protein
VETICEWENGKCANVQMGKWEMLRRAMAYKGATQRKLNMHSTADNKTLKT